jgi:hypothetical protein
MDVSLKTSAPALCCAVCHIDDDGEPGWRIYLTAGHPSGLETLCPACAERGRGEDER